jgi:hypothetical protein
MSIQLTANMSTSLKYYCLDKVTLGMYKTRLLKGVPSFAPASFREARK